MKQTAFALKGTLVHTPTPDAFEVWEDAYLVCEGGAVKGVWPELPEAFAGIPVEDYTGKIIIPGMADMHLHAPQYGFRGMGINMAPDSVWNTWFETYALPEERRYASMEYAEAAYEKFCQDLLHTPTTRMSAFATIHRPATLLLMDKLAEKGFAAYVGKVNTDRNSIEGLLETTEETLRETRLWLEESCDRHTHVKPILTPRYIPSCTDACMEGLQALAEAFGVPAQSHLSENLEELEWVRQLRPDADFYGQAYDMYGLFGSSRPTVMAHCIFPTEEEFELMAQRKNLWVAHCPQSNLHSCGSAAPVRRYMQAGIHVGIGSDMAGSNTLNLMRAIADCDIAARVYWAANERGDDANAPKTYLKLSEAFYIATVGGGSFWGQAGSFEAGSLFDAVVIDDGPLQDLNTRPVLQRMERIINQSDDRHVAAKYINGRKVL